MSRSHRPSRSFARIVAATLGMGCLMGTPVPEPVGPLPAARLAHADGGDDVARRRCEAQGLLYNLFWRPDTYGSACWSLMEQHCAQGGKDVALAVVGMAADVASGGPIGLDAWAQASGCLLVLQTCFADFRRACGAECAYDPLAYAPNPSVRYGGSNGRPQGVTYDAAAHVVRVTVRNTGYALCRDIGYSVSVGSTADEDRHVTGTVVTSGTIPRLSPASTTRTGAAIPPKEFTFSVPWEPAAGRYNEFLVAIDGSQLIDETNELDNIARLVVDLLPTTCRAEIASARVDRAPTSLSRATLTAGLHAVGPQACEVTWAVLPGAPPTGTAPLASGAADLEAGSTRTVTAELPVDAAHGSPSGARTAKFTLRVLGLDGRVHAEEVVVVPLFAGRVSGRVTDGLGRAVAGAAVVSTAAGADVAATRTDAGGFYHLDGIAVLGDVAITATHPSSAARASRTVTLAFDPGGDEPGRGLAHDGIDLVLVDAPGTLTITVMDAATRRPLGGATWAATHPPDRLAGTLDATTATTTVPGCPPGEWLVTASRAGYATATERTVLRAGESATVVLWLEPFRPRLDDRGLQLFPPEALWSRTLDGWVYAHASSKDGRLLVLYTADPSAPGSGRLRFLDALLGTERVAVAVASPKGQQQVSLDVAYQGDPVAFFVHEGGFGRTGAGSLALYDASGRVRATRSAPPREHPFVEVSPDGAFVHAWGLFDATLGEIPDARALDPRGYPQGWPQERFLVAETVHLTRDGAVVGACRVGPGTCRFTRSEQVLATWPDVARPLRLVDSGGPVGAGETLLVCGDRTVQRLTGPTVTFTLRPADLDPPAGPTFASPSAALSPGGEVVMLVEGARHGRLHVYSWGPRPSGRPLLTEADREVTPPGLGPWVQHVSANEAGLFFLVVEGHEATYYRMGAYRPRPPPRPN